MNFKDCICKRDTFRTQMLVIFRECKDETPKLDFGPSPSASPDCIYRAFQTDKLQKELESGESTWLQKQVRSDVECYCHLWNHFPATLDQFYGEEGSSSFKRDLSLMADIIHMTNDKYYLNLNNSMGGMLDGHPDNGKVFIDIGANVGQSVKLFESLFPKGADQKTRFILFEPNPQNIAILRSRVQRSTPTISRQTTVVPAAVGNKVGVAEFDFPSHENPAGNQLGHLANQFGALSQSSFQVDMVTLDHIFQNDETIRQAVIPYLKIDTEGFDVVVMAGARRVLNRVRILLYECHILMRSDINNGPGTTHKDAQEILTSHGFLTFKISARQWIPFTGSWYNPLIDDARHMNWQNCIAIRPFDPLLPILYEKHNLYSDCSFVTTNSD
eukprot:TRINITY_DN4406_c0_g1_i1.p1 TRINITY_DN4406_c0_g1~~TRINITY_DN4406_c0_g1_i1.p1  ORF type:complete len:386 (-),score=57.72 TRINITY_DN4406_c0_g1_i1:108-1265(-)